MISGIYPLGLKKSKRGVDFLHVLGRLSGISCGEPSANCYECNSSKGGDDGDDDEEFDESEPSFWIRGSVCFHLVVEAWMSGRGDQAVFTISSILNGFLGRVKSVAPISPDGGLVLLITFNSFFPDQNGDLDETG